MSSQHLGCNVVPSVDLGRWPRRPYPRFVNLETCKSFLNKNLENYQKKRKVTQYTGAILDKISKPSNKTFPCLISMLQGSQRCFA